MWASAESHLLTRGRGGAAAGRVQAGQSHDAEEVHDADALHLLEKYVQGTEGGHVCDGADHLQEGGHLRRVEGLPRVVGGAFGFGGLTAQEMGACITSRHFLLSVSKSPLLGVVLPRHLHTRTR